MLSINYDFSFILTHISTIAVFIMAYMILRIKNKSQIQRVFFSIIILLLCWNLGTILEMYFRKLFNYTEMIFVNISYLAICFIPVLILLLGTVFARTKINFTWKYFSLFIIPIISTIIIWTNESHKLFFVNYSIYSKEAIYGIYYYFHSIYSYICILVGLIILGYFSMKNSGFFSRQSVLILLGISIPLVVNILYSFNLADLAFNINSIAFSFAIICFAFAILKFKFLNVVPVALQRIVDLMSDGYIVINENYEIIDYNKTYIDMFRDVLIIRRKRSFIEILDTVDFIDSKEFINYNETAISKRKTVNFEKHIKLENFDKHFKIEVIPIFTTNDYIGTIFLMKDISGHKRNIETIKRNQEIIMEQERLASLGQMIGGIAHNLKTPIMSIAGGLEALGDLTKEYDESIDDSNVTKEDHHEIAKEMKDWVEKLKPYLSYMSEIITAVKDQAVNLSASSSVGFTIHELVKRIEILMKHELKRNHCKLNLNVKVNENTELDGEVSSLIQIFDNLIINSIHAYEEKGGDIYFIIKEDEDNIEFIVKDEAKGIPKEVQQKLFKQMYTTKGKNGTGLGLYMSYSTIKGRFKGDMWFESQEGKGTTFHIVIPKKRKSA